MWPRSFAAFRNSSQATREFPIAAPIPTVQCSLTPSGEPAKMKIVAIRVLRVAPALGIEPDFVAQIFEVRGDQRQGIFRRGRIWRHRRRRSSFLRRQCHVRSDTRRPGDNGQGVMDRGPHLFQEHDTHVAILDGDHRVLPGFDSELTATSGTYAVGTADPAASADFTSRAWRHWPRYSKPGQLHVTSAPSAVMR